MAHSRALFSATFAIAFITFTAASIAAAQFSTLDRQQVSTNVGADVGVVAVDSPNDRIDTIGHIQLHAEVGSGTLGAYTALPIMFTLSGSPHEFTVGNLEVGGAHRWDINGPLSLVSHIGLVFPTADNSTNHTIVRTAGSSTQLGDLYISSVPRLWAVRVATSPRLDAGIFFAQADLGFDFLFPRHSSDEVGMRTSVGIGARILLVTAAAEIANAGLISEDDSFEQTASFSLRLKTGILNPHVSYIFNLDDSDNYEIRFGASIGF